MSVRPKLHSYAIQVDSDGQLTQEDGGLLSFAGRWTPEHLVLAALASCVVTSLAYHARRAGLTHSASGSASGVVGPRDDSSWGFLEIECSIDVEVDPPPKMVEALLTRAERGCFVGASLVPKPRYRWTVNGEVVR